MRNIAARRMSVAEIKEAIDKAAAFRPTPGKK
jgi:hypothetical protein